VTVGVRLPFLVASEALDEETRLVIVTGEVDLATAPQVERELAPGQSSSETRLVVDLTKTTFFDARLLALLVRTDRSLRRRGGRVAVVCPDPWQRRILRLARLDRRLGIGDTLDDTLGALGALDGAGPTPPETA
jgi:anti-sigma B factor antagonist